VTLHTPGGKRIFGSAGLIATSKEVILEVHIVYFCNVSASDREFAGADVREDGDEEMGSVVGCVC